MSPLLAGLAVILPPISFAAGVVVGRLTARHPGRSTMSPADVPSAIAGRTRAFYERWAPALYVLIFVIAAFGVFVGSTSALASGRVVDCLERHAEANTERNAVVLEAGELLTTRQKRFSRTLAAALQAPQASPSQRHLFAKFTDANNRLLDAYRNLEDVRDDNPAIPEPAEFCDL